jgi:hypothetical protein
LAFFFLTYQITALAWKCWWGSVGIDRRVVWLFDSMSDRNRFIWFNWNFCANEIASHWLCTQLKRNARNDRLYFFSFFFGWAKLEQRTVKPRNAFKISRYLVFFRLILKEKRKQNIKYYLDMRHVHISGDRTSSPLPLRAQAKSFPFVGTSLW